jgi:hypothetical protein
MTSERQDGLQCSQFEALMAELLEAEVAATDRRAEAESEQKPAFDAHRKSCPACGPLFAGALEGLLLLRSLREVDPPRHLIHNILAATSLAEAPAKAAVEQAKPGLRQGWQKLLRPAPILGSLLHSRFAMSFCMAFFSLSLTLSLAGVRLPDIFKMVSHPSTLGRSVVLQYTQVEAKFISYYENMRVVYEFESRVNQFKKSATPQNNNKPEQQNQNRPVPADKDREHENYSREGDGSLIAVSALKNEGAQL